MRGSALPTRVVGLLVALALLATACGGDEPAETTAAPTPAATADAVEPTVSEPAEAPRTEVEVEVPTEATAEPTATPTPTPAPAATATAAPVDGAGDSMDVGGATTYDAYTVVTDDTGAIQVEIPAEWAQVDGRPYDDAEGRQFYDVRASTDLEAFSTGWEVPGIIVNASTDAAQSQNETALLDERVGVFSGVCTYVGRQPYDDGLYTGQADVYENCAGTETGYLILGAVPSSRAFLIRVEVQVVEERDLEALQRALDTFVIVGDV